ncbi:hypothetical protein CGLO_16456 [Colletotrichum gloeosporioides Cg-14]|uniref:Uncharacterized protein n=1 Tax=Colletotrichum gloeosporioides (strain Cg-14) TaxID=1237896 RepID=T0JW21_COLGC|nr:hypothetical protein CGLO_16456 [Colletotrichum gloeosporioides Cg-14]
MFKTPTWSLGTGGLVEERAVGAERLLTTFIPNTSRFNSHVGLASLHAPLGTRADSVYSWSLRRGTVPPSSRPALLARLLWGLTLAASPPAPDTLPAVLSVLCTATAAILHCAALSKVHFRLRYRPPTTTIQQAPSPSDIDPQSHKVLHAAPSLPIRPLVQRAGLPSDGD